MGSREKNIRPWDWVYQTKRYKKARQAVMKRDKGLCVHCLRLGKVKPGNVAHHIVELDESNMNDEAIAFGLDNLELWNRECHEIHHGRTFGPTVDGIEIDEKGDIIFL